MQYTHSGQRYLLGYGRSFFGIWDRQMPNAPLERFARDDAGWAAAWRRFTQLETHYTEVGLGGTGSSGSTGHRRPLLLTAGRTRRAPLLPRPTPTRAARSARAAVPSVSARRPYPLGAVQDQFGTRQPAPDAHQDREHHTRARASHERLACARPIGSPRNDRR